MKLRFDALALTILLKRATPLFLTLASIGCGGGQTTSGTPPPPPPPVPQYKLTILPNLPGRTTTEAIAINDAGVIVGAEEGTAIVWHNGVASALASPTEPSRAVAINASGDIVGDFIDPNTTLSSSTAILWTADGNFTAIGTLPGFDSSSANDIDVDGTVVGLAYTRDNQNFVGAPFKWRSDTGVQAIPELIFVDAINNGFIAGTAPNHHAALLKDGNLIDLGVATSGAADVNAAGHVIGSFVSGNGFPNGFAWLGHDPMVQVTATGPMESSTEARGINDSDQAVGLITLFDPLGNAVQIHTRAMMWTASGGTVDLNTLIAPGSGFTLVWANAINNKGVIVGAASKTVTVLDTVGFVLEPLP
jgi:uncharacterized membrane protein